MNPAGAVEHRDPSAVFVKGQARVQVDRSRAVFAVEAFRNVRFVMEPDTSKTEPLGVKEYFNRQVQLILHRRLDCLLGGLDRLLGQRSGPVAVALSQALRGNVKGIDQDFAVEVTLVYVLGQCRFPKAIIIFPTFVVVAPVSSASV